MQLLVDGHVQSEDSVSNGSSAGMQRLASVQRNEEPPDSTEEGKPPFVHGDDSGS